ncbi:MAG: hypothetical protein ACR2PL_28040 [Dehalococcoidia bacterium]
MNKVPQILREHLSRRTLLNAVGAVGAGVLLAQSTGLLGVAATAAEGKAERVQDVLDILSTQEAFGVTLVGTVLDYAKNGAYTPAIPEKVIKILTNVRAQEQFHLDFFRQAGGHLRTDTFYLADPKMLSDPHTLFKDLVELEDAAIAASMAAMPAFMQEQRVDLVKANFQFAAEEAEHRLLANRALGTRPANDVAFSPALFTTIAQFYALLEKKGIVGGSLGGKKITYPGAGKIAGSKVISTTPGGPQVSCS